MILTLTNAYPVLPPGTLTQEQEDAFAEVAGDHTLELRGVVAVQQLHTFTVEFDINAFVTARQLTGWELWSRWSPVLEARCDPGGGYGPFPGILVNKPYIYEGIQISDRTEYCGFILSEG